MTTGHYILSEVFCQDPIERYFSKQRHRGGGCTVEQFKTISAILMQRLAITSELKTMNFQSSHVEQTTSMGPLPKRKQMQAMKQHEN